MEADLQRFYGVDYRDRWRPDEHGRPRLTLRRLHVLVAHLPPDSATAAVVGDGEPGWSRSDVLLTDLWSAWTGKEHPRIARARRSHGRPVSADRMRRLREARARARDRRRRIESGEIT